MAGVRPRRAEAPRMIASVAVYARPVNGLAITNPMTMMMNRPMITVARGRSGGRQCPGRSHDPVSPRRFPSRDSLPGPRAVFRLPRTIPRKSGTARFPPGGEPVPPLGGSILVLRAEAACDRRISGKLAVFESDVRGNRGLAYPMVVAWGEHDRITRYGARTVRRWAIRYRPDAGAARSGGGV